MKTHYQQAISIKAFLAIAFAFATLVAQAQYSNLGFAFQGYAIDGNSKAVASTGVTVRFTVYRTGVNYVEEHTLTTDAYGVFVANVGEGTASTSLTFGELDFNNFDFSMKVEVRETVGGTFVTISDKALQAVPFARAASNGVPVGTVMAFAGPSTNIPTGWLICDGTTLNSTTNPQYKQLFAAIGTTWGGSGASSFNLPDLRGMFLRGVNGTRADAFADAGRTIGTTQTDATARPTTAFTGSTSTDGNHNHNYTDPLIGSFPNLARDSDGTSVEYATSNGGTTTTNGNHSHTFSVSGGGDSETRPNNAAVFYIIKY